MTFLLDEPWLVFITVCIALFSSSVLGYRLALSTRINEDSHHHEHITGLREGLFVLLGLLLGFSVAIVLPRFDERRHGLSGEPTDGPRHGIECEQVCPNPRDTDRFAAIMVEYMTR
jgi:hypothetical protein